MDGLIIIILEGGRIFIRGDLNEYVGKICRRYEIIHKAWRFVKMNGMGYRIPDFSMKYDLVIANMYFQKYKNIW